MKIKYMASVALAAMAIYSCDDSISSIGNSLTDEGDKLERAVSAGKENDLSVSIGSENLFSQLSNTSMIVGRYRIRGHDGGALGIIGPTRLDYAKLIPRIEYLTELVSKMLSDTFEE